MQPLIITIDGPAGTGKSTVAFGLSQELGLEFLDTGAMYRALTVCCVHKGIEPSTSPQEAARIAGDVELRFDWTTQPPRLLASGTDVTDELREPEINKRVSDLAVIPEVREVLVLRQQEIAQVHPRLVSEGRDQGSVVFPGAQFKFYLDAHPETRAQRRVDQIRRGGGDVDHREVLQNLTQRDLQDTSRTEGPLICPDDAVRVDTTDLSAEQVIKKIQAHIETRLKTRSAIETDGEATLNRPSPVPAPNSEQG